MSFRIRTKLLITFLAMLVPLIALIAITHLNQIVVYDGVERTEEWIVMIAGSAVLTALGVSFSLFYSRRFARPIETMCGRADSIARGNFKGRIAIKTGDELDLLANAMNEMAAQLESSYSERKHAEDAVGRAKREWETSVDAISDPLFIHDREFKVVRANRAYRNAAGLPFEEIIGRPYYEVFPKMDGPHGTCLKVMGSLEEAEEEVALADRIFKVRFYPVRGVDGEYLYSIHFMEDITEAKRASEKIKEEMEVTSNLLSIAEACAHTTDVDKLMESIIRCGREIARCDICLSYLWDSETGSFRPSQAVGLSHDLIPLFKTESLDMNVGFVREAMKKREPVIMQFGVGSSEFGGFSWLSGINTVAAIPLIGKQGYLGLIVGGHTKPALTLHPLREREFTERDMKVMRGIMHQVSTAIEQAGLYKDSIEKGMELSKKIETIQAMHEIDRNILSTLEPRTIIETAVRMVARVIPCDSASVFLVDRERGGFVFEAGFGIVAVPKWAFEAFEATDATDVLKTGRPQYLANLADIKEPLPGEKELVREGFLSIIRVPLTTKGEVIGVLSLGARRPSAFTPKDLSTLEKLAFQIGIALENARLLKNLEELFLGTVRSLASAIDAKSKWTRGHSERVTEVALEIGGEIGLNEEELGRLRLSALLHDVGKIGTYEHILDKPDKLTDDEVAIMQEHVVNGVRILSPIKAFSDIIPAIRSHHENYDGTGYPDGLRGEDIPLMGRILALADSYDAMKSDRPYRSRRTMDFVVAEFKRCSGTQFDPKVVEAFLRVIEKGEGFKMAAN